MSSAVGGTSGMQWALGGVLPVIARINAVDDDTARNQLISALAAVVPTWAADPGRYAAHLGLLADLHRDRYEREHNPADLDALRRSKIPYYRAMSAALDGHNSDALAALDGAMAQHSSMLVMLPTEPAFDRLRRDPRFQAMQRKVGMKE